MVEKRKGLLTLSKLTKEVAELLENDFDQVTGKRFEVREFEIRQILKHAEVVKKNWK